MRISNLKLTTYITAVAAVMIGQTRGEQCHPVTPDEKSALEAFVKQWYNVPGSTTVTLVNSDSADQACYRKLEFRASVPAPLLTLYLAPDRKHLAADFMDMTADPVVMRRRRQQDVANRLSKDALLTSGPADARQQIVVFSDFQCPYCKQFAELMRQMNAGDRASVRVVYRQMPLNNHAWAHEAAELSECVALQNKATFWRLHDFLFDHQEKLSKQNISQKVMDFLSREQGIDTEAVTACKGGKQVIALLQDDEQLAMDMGVASTPSVFVNGRGAAIRSLADLRAALRSSDSNHSESLGNSNTK